MEWKKIKNEQPEAHCMKTAILLSMIFLLPCIANSQEGKRDFLTLQIGAAFPVGAFAENDYENDDPGFAVTGINLELHYAHELSRKWGYLIALKVNSFPLDEKAKLYQNGFPDDSFRISADNYNIYGINGGLFYNLIKHEKFTFQINGQFGVNAISYPKTIIEQPVNLYVKIETDGNRAINFSGVARASAQFYVSQKFDLSASLGFMHTRASYDMEWSSIFGSQSWSGKVQVKQPISVIDLGIGLIYTLERKPI